MPSAQVNNPIRSSTRLQTKPPVNYRALIISQPAKQKTFHVYDIIDRSIAPPPMYRVRWFGYPDPDSDSWESGANLIEDGFEDLCKHIDAFKSWEAEGEDGEVRTLAQFRKKHQVSELIDSYCFFLFLLFYFFVCILATKNIHFGQ